MISNPTGFIDSSEDRCNDEEAEDLAVAAPCRREH